jgi:ABC-type nickel/cobalt efflux system permease component RcnA
LPASLVTITITHVVAFAVAIAITIALVATIDSYTRNPNEFTK